MKHEEYLDKLYPDISEEAKKELELLLSDFQQKILNQVKEIQSDFYTEIAPHIESDVWTNIRIKILDGLKNYKYANKIFGYDYKLIRKQIFEENKEEIIKDLNEDLLFKIKSLEEEIRNLHKNIYA